MFVQTSILEAQQNKQEYTRGARNTSRRERDFFFFQFRGVTIVAAENMHKISYKPHTEVIKILHLSIPATQVLIQNSP